MPTQLGVKPSSAPNSARSGAKPGTSPDSVQAEWRRFGEKEDRPRRRKAQLFSFLAVASGLLYLWVVPPGLNPEAPLVGFAFMAAEIACLGLFILAAASVWTIRMKPRSGLTSDVPKSIDVFITVCGEPLDAVDRSLQSAANLEWDGEITVYVLDDGGDPAVEARASELGFQYLSRPAHGLDREHGKAGNLNFGLERSSGELIFVIDADHAIRSVALKPMAGYMKFERVAFVQSKQTFIVPTGDPFNSGDLVFYDAVQLGFDADDSVISCGSGVLYRRAALDDIGGFATWNLVEDLTTSYHLHSRGWKSLYYPYPVTSGLAPANIREVYQQRGQWALDTMRIFFWDNPLFKKGLTWQSRLNHLMIGLSYIWAGFFVPIFFLVPLWTYLTGTPLVVQDEVAIVATRLAYFLFFVGAGHYLFRGRDSGKQFQLLAGLFPVYVRGTLRALRYPPGHKPKVRVNNARSTKKTTRPLWTALIPQGLIFGGNLVLPFYAMFRGLGNPWIILANMVVSAFVLWSLWPTIFEGLRNRSDSLTLAGLGNHDGA